MTTTRDRHAAPAGFSGEPRSPVYGVLIGLTSLGVLLQGLWAGLFLGRGAAGGFWIGMHAMGAQVTLLLAVVALVVALVRLRRRTALVAATAAFAVLILLEGLIGVWTSGSTSLTAVHVPLAMLLLVLAVYLPVLHGHGTRTRR